MAMDDTLMRLAAGWDAKALKARVSFGEPGRTTLDPPHDAPERRYALRAVQQRLYMASFREAVITAYNGRCAASRSRRSITRRSTRI